MSHRSRQLRVSSLARVEGEGALRVVVADGTVERAELDIYEPPRFFEALLRGRAYTEPPDITARICGICPVAYQTSACNALEQVCGVELDPELAALRRLLYCGEWISSHALHIHLLHLPDFLGYPDAITLAKDHLEVVEHGLAMKKAGNALLELIGGRSIHPINVRVGGFYRVPSRADLVPLAEQLRRALDYAVGSVARVAELEFPDLELEHDLLAAVTPDQYAIEGGSVVTSTGLSFPADEFGDHVVESQVPHSTALHARLDGRLYLTGPLARYSLNSRHLSPLARQVAAAAGLGPECRNPFRSIVVRAVEVVYAIDEALRLIGEYSPPTRPAVPCTPRAGVGHGVSEAPRGLLYHRYEIDDAGLIGSATIVPPTSQNQAAIEDDLRRVVAANLDLDDPALTTLCERTIRNYDPCISCSAHFLELDMVRR
ncbi:Ni/Fe hydrogenase subunit alpha [Nocardia seriolae]|uniref:Dehydrogenase n=1 Tax=Nocardia seriolae TaxID=37332 RepID=A0A0B8NKH4_9NOCA|nr:nickel-dependent hydrogenase large subunit [Nocardia seriolae]APA98421.1 Hydrogen dehydrogenase (NADP(+)) [Nocardia seriolae]MTJ64115.1 Ni/Fe hydrogenase subunit alpha [Nocardia seriolae]MTJ73632.1 Ni/Fe hydrogenase subunit alpha [Nocardia seriolae]MTJ88105.1 Ni/Fe hydrogenase subunit alpha [Nocardia seriolae]MTK32095.1 Ni/Fe hydrogenase subunit alpha [Nocardia seriolae]